MNSCPNCGHKGIPLPVEPLYSVARAAAMVSTTRGTLLALLEEHQTELPPPYYRMWGRRRVWCHRGSLGQEAPRGVSYREHVR